MKVILYTTHCAQCAVLENMFKNKNIDFVEITDVSIMKEKGFMSVPWIEVDGNLMNMKDAIGWLKEVNA